MAGHEDNEEPFMPHKKISKVTEATVGQDLKHTERLGRCC